MRFAVEPTSFPPKGYALHALRTRFRKNLEAVPILLIVAKCLLCPRPDILLWIQVWRITCHFGEHEAQLWATRKPRNRKANQSRSREVKHY